MRKSKRLCETESELGKGAGRVVTFDVGVLSDSCNSPAYRISSTPVVFKPCRGAAALSSLTL